MPVVPAPEPQEIYERTRDEGRRRLSRPLLELAATAIVGGFDVAFGVAALREARARDLATVALVGYGGGLVVAERLADHVIVSRSEHIPRIQEAQASAYHVLRELVEIAGAA